MGDALAWTAPHHDGVANLLKYAFNLDGTTPDVSHLAAGTGVRGLPSIVRAGSGAGTTLNVEYVRRRNPRIGLYAAAQFHAQFLHALQRG
ncbi:MAG: hypothetical protein QM755_02050 [Luteolibacter sp.]